MKTLLTAIILSALSCTKQQAVITTAASEQSAAGRKITNIGFLNENVADNVVITTAVPVMCATITK